MDLQIELQFQDLFHQRKPEVYNNSKTTNCTKKVQFITAEDKGVRPRKFKGKKTACNRGSMQGYKVAKAGITFSFYLRLKNRVKVSQVQRGNMLCTPRRGPECPNGKDLHKWVKRASIMRKKKITKQDEKVYVYKYIYINWDIVYRKEHQKRWLRCEFSRYQEKHLPMQLGGFIGPHYQEKQLPMQRTPKCCRQQTESYWRKKEQGSWMLDGSSMDQKPTLVQSLFFRRLQTLEIK